MDLAGFDNDAGCIKTRADVGRRIIVALKDLIHQDVQGRPGFKFSDYFRIIGEGHHGLLLSCFGLSIALRVYPRPGENGGHGEIRACLLDGTRTPAETELLVGWHFDEEGNVFQESAARRQIWRIDEAVISYFEFLMVAIVENGRVSKPHLVSTG